MDSPFSDIYRDQNERKRSAQEQNNWLRQVQMAEKQAYQSVYEQYKPIVDRILSYLHRDFYPGHQVGGWKFSRTYCINGASTTFIYFSVEILLDDFNLPAGFQCKRAYFKTRLRDIPPTYTDGRWVNERTVRCGLSENQLIDAIRNLHPDYSYTAR